MNGNLRESEKGKKSLGIYPKSGDVLYQRMIFGEANALFYNTNSSLCASLQHNTPQFHHNVLYYQRELLISPISVHINQLIGSQYIQYRFDGSYFVWFISLCVFGPSIYCQTVSLILPDFCSMYELLHPNYLL